MIWSIIIVCLAASCIFMKQYRLVNDEFIIESDKNSLIYSKRFDSISINITFQNVNCGWYSCRYTISNNSLEDTAIVNLMDLEIIDQWGLALSETIDGERVYGVNKKEITLPPDSTVKYLFVAFSPKFENRKYWADSVWILLPKLSSSDGSIHIPGDTLLFIRK